MGKIVKEYRNTLKQRVGHIAYMKEVPVDNAPSTYERVVTRIVFNITLGFSKPLMTLDDDIIEKCFVKELVTSPVEKLGDGFKISLCDEIYESRNNGKERFVYIGDIVDPLVSSKSMLLYDRRYKDVIFAPSITDMADKINMDTAAGVILDVVGSSIGCYDESNTDLFLNENICITAGNLYTMPEFKEGMTLTTKLLTIPGSDPDTAFKDTNLMEKLPNSESYIIRGETRPRTFIKLGKTSDFITSADKNIPLHYPYWYSPTSLKLAYGSVNTGGNKDVYFELGS